MLVARFLLILALVLLFVSFAAYNMEMVDLTVSPAGAPLSLPLYSVIFLALFAGGLVAYVLGLIDRFSISRRLREKDREIERLRGELQALRNLPIVDDLGRERKAGGDGGASGTAA